METDQELIERLQNEVREAGEYYAGTCKATREAKDNLKRRLKALDIEIGLPRIKGAEIQAYQALFKAKERLRVANAQILSNSKPIRSYRLPDGEDTYDVDLYLSSWHDEARVIVETFGWKIIACNPGFQFDTGKESVTLSVSAVRSITAGVKAVCDLTAPLTVAMV